MKKFFEKIKDWYVWLTSKRVLDAINGGLSYDEVDRIAKEEMRKS